MRGASYYSQSLVLFEQRASERATVSRYINFLMPLGLVFPSPSRVESTLICPVEMAFRRNCKEHN